ncbi:MAG: methyltransferase domain-containing protein [Nitrospiraceae bacterium]|nr:methyltransferase domain-containing protein [Nitrospiraceae bacterium]
MKWDAQKYDAVKAPQIDAGRELIALARVRENDDILDLGCGTGKLTADLARLASKGSVTGVDPSEEMLGKAKDVSNITGNMRLVKAAAEDLSFDSAFDLVFSNSAMQWVKEQSRAVQAAHRSLKKGGRIAFQLPARDFCPAFFSGVETAVSDLGYERFFEGWQSPWYFPGQREYAHLLANAGFASVDVFPRQYELVFSTVNDVTAWWSSAGLRPYLASLPETAHPYFLEAFGESFERRRTEKGIEFNFTRLFALANK